MKIYTKTGDQGTTSLATGERVCKTDNRIEAYGTSDELNSFVGYLRAAIEAEQAEWSSEIDNHLYSVQNQLFNIGATLAGAPVPLSDGATEALENAMDNMQAELPPTHAFILPTGGEIVSRCHICRTITRRLERACLRIDDAHTTIPSELVYLNRLSDYFFVLSRWIGIKKGAKVSIWKK